MVRRGRLSMLAFVALTASVVAIRPCASSAATGAEISRDASAALSALYRSQPAAKALGQRAKGILVFPHMLKAGFMFGGQIGEGALMKNGKTVAYYNSVAASYGLQAGAQKFGYALFFMNDAALKQLNTTKGFEVGVGPSIVVLDSGAAKSFTSNTATSDVYAFIFSQKGLMAGLGIQGSKITKISK